MRQKGYRHYGASHRYRDLHHLREREHHPRVSIGLFFILLGAALLVATNDLLHLGSFNRYFTLESAMLFIGILLLLNLKFTGGILLVAGGVWFLKDTYFIANTEFMNIYYWPAVIGLIGLSFIVSSLIKRKNKQ
jgi:hypothetical protein